MENNFTPGCGVWVVKRDEDGCPVGVSGYMFITDVLEYAILTPYVYGLETIKETLEYHEQECRENYDTELVVAKLSDCYSYKEFAEEAVREEVSDSNAK